MFFNFFNKEKKSKTVEKIKEKKPVVKPANFLRNPEVFLEALIEQSVRNNPKSEDKSTKDK